MIPKIIHYCWFGGKEKPQNVQKCIASWKKYLSDYEFMEWNETNFNVHKSSYVEDAYNAKKFAFVSDVARIEALYEYGGFYMDTDVEVYRSFDELLSRDCVLGFEEKNYVATSFMAVEPKHPLMKEFINLYSDLNFYDVDGNIILGTNVLKFTNMLLEKGLIMNGEYQELENNIEIYPQKYFSPYDYINCYLKIEKETYCVHHFYVSWMSWKEQVKKKSKKILVRIIGRNSMNRLRKKFKR